MMFSMCTSAPGDRIHFSIGSAGHSGGKGRHVHAVKWTKLLNRIVFQSATICILSALITSASFAGQYAVTYTSGGTTTIDWISGDMEASYPYNPLNHGFGDVAVFGWVYDAGPIVAQLTWVLDGPSTSGSPSLPGHSKRWTRQRELLSARKYE